MDGSITIIKATVVKKRVVCFANYFMDIKVTVNIIWLFTVACQLLLST